jgi:hypothetical protein
MLRPPLARVANLFVHRPIKIPTVSVATSRLDYCRIDKRRWFPARFLTKFGIEIDGRSKQKDGSVQ